MSRQYKTLIVNKMIYKEMSTINTLNLLYFGHINEIDNLFIHLKQLIYIIFHPLESETFGKFILSQVH